MISKIFEMILKNRLADIEKRIQTIEIELSKENKIIEQSEYSNKIALINGKLVRYKDKK